MANGDNDRDTLRPKYNGSRNTICKARQLSHAEIEMNLSKCFNLG